MAERLSPVGRKSRHRRHANPLSRHAHAQLDCGAWDRAARGVRPIALDLGCGAGAFTVALAARHPDWDVVGVEIRAHLVARVNRAMAARQLPHGRAVLANASVHLAEVVPPASVAMATVNFPDPWFKKRHHKRRLVSRAWLASLATTLRPRAEVHLMTDVAPLALAMAEALEGAPGFISLHPGRPFAPESTTGIVSEREATHLARGAPIYRLHSAYIGAPAPLAGATFLLAPGVQAG